MDITRDRLKRGIIFSVSISIIAIIMIFIYTREDFSFKMFSRIDTTYFVLACYITAGFWVLKGLKLQVLAGTLGIELNLSKALAIYLGSMFVSHVTPSSSGGLPFQIYFLHREGLTIGQSTSLSVTENMINLIFFVSGTPFLFFIWGHYLNLDSSITKIFFPALLLVVLFVLISIILIFNADLAMVFVNWLLKFRFIDKFLEEEKKDRIREYVDREIFYFQEGINVLLDYKKALTNS